MSYSNSVFDWEEKYLYTMRMLFNQVESYKPGITWNEAGSRPEAQLDVCVCGGGLDTFTRGLGAFE